MSRATTRTLRFKRARPELSNRERNIQRILNPPKPTLRDRTRRVRWAAEEWWQRHVTQRDLYRRLDAAGRIFRANPRDDWGAPEHAEHSLQRIREDASAHQADNA
ncbi:hypothetical protein ABT274_12225 [Streptomyces sp. NPDC001127]|uniref:hypothetical protein n=1 Tax=Streptomyces sp. NPDC001127 TaxID=3154377 RepID=UPI00331C423E